eukprot:GEMP01101861.1.p2 GENE.GEMP01101861.1~~GEMP01101861.1.p2  ORF type:complete len:116 (+),score=21.72 GEMP01101861.1:145-492(+)
MPPWDAAKEKDFEEVFQFLDVLGTGAVGLDDVKILLQACGLNPSDDAIQKMIAFETGDGSCAFTRATFVQAVKVAFCFISSLVSLFLVLVFLSNTACKYGVFVSFPLCFVSNVLG